MTSRNFENLEKTILKCGGEYGFFHSKRLLEIIKIIGKGMEYNRGIMEFCAYAHDLGAYAPYAKEDTDHAVRSRQMIDEIMAPYDFSPEEKTIIYEAVAFHHQPITLKSTEAILLRDADAIDFLGFIGAARDITRANRDLKKGIKTLRGHREKLPANITLESSKKLAEERIKETDLFLKRFEEESFNQF
jgi:uncharacterized protein